MNDYGMRSLSEDSGNNLNHIHVESLCETVSEFLETLDGSDFRSDELIEKRLSESECSILDCGLIVADIKNITEDIDRTFISTMERDRDELIKIFGNLERVTDQVIPALEEDLNQIEQLTITLEMRLAKMNREKNIGWLKKFIPGTTVKVREDHAHYTNQVAACSSHSIDSLLEHFELQQVNKEVSATNTEYLSGDADYAML